jgi:hypothetical protein
MKQILLNIKKYFTTWWIPIIANFIAIGIFILGNVFKRDWIIDLSLAVFFLNIIGTIISSVVNIINHKWYYIIPQLGLATFLFYYTALIFTNSPPDYYGANKTLPKDIEFSVPLDTLPSDQEFELYNLILTYYLQPGIYKYYTDYIPKETGYFYVKAFEIISNDRLSGTRMKESSKVEVNNLEIKRHEGEFTIYEGDWGDKYGSRIELWYQPSNGNQEYKICQRNYIVEGWQR